MLRNLKSALATHNVPAYNVAKRAGIHESKLSRIVREVTDPSEEEKLKLSGILGQPVEWLFPSIESSNQPKGLSLP